MFYEDSFDQEMPKLKTEQEKEAVKAAVLRIINEMRKEIIAIATTNTCKAVSGEIEVTIEPKVIAGKKDDRKSLYIKNTGVTICKVYAMDDSSNNGYPINPGESITYHASNGVAIATLSGISTINYLDS